MYCNYLVVGHDNGSRRREVSPLPDEQDLPNMIGSQSSLNQEYVTDGVSGEIRVLSDPKDIGKSWETNYHEAAIFLEVCLNASFMSQVYWFLTIMALGKMLL